MIRRDHVGRDIDHPVRRINSVPYIEEANAARPGLESRGGKNVVRFAEHLRLGLKPPLDRLKGRQEFLPSSKLLGPFGQPAQLLPRGLEINEAVLRRGTAGHAYDPFSSRSSSARISSAVYHLPFLMASIHS